ncbi:MAG: Septum formation initiator [Parcubacteria group bacterium GW2011_GWF2_43_11]|nr:MAG: Septum formation initiator [Parcubacteria group bacterium GW2011_GWF2_43_11]
MIAKSKKIKNTSKQTIFLSVFLSILLFTVVGYLVVSNLQINSRRAELNSQLIKLQAELNALEAKKAQLQAQVSEVANDEYLDKEARETFNLKKPGEEVVTILPAESSEGLQKEENFFLKIIDKIKFW